MEILRQSGSRDVESRLETIQELNQCALWEYYPSKDEIVATRPMYLMLDLPESKKTSLLMIEEKITIESRIRFHECVVKTITKAQPFEIDVELKTRESDKPRIMMVAGVPIRDEFQFLIRGCIRDVTHERDKLRVITKQKEDAEFKKAEMANVVSVVAHDLRAPVNEIVALTTLMSMKNDLPPEDAKIVSMLTDAGFFASRIIGDILEGFDGSQSLKLEKTDVVEVLDGRVKLLGIIAKDKNQSIKLNAPQSCVAQIDSDKFTRIINNLITNAIKFSPEHAVIDIDLVMGDQSFKISVNDRGVGIPTEVQGKMFEMFSGIKRPGTNGERSFGLGLFISRKLVQLHRGKIWVENREGGGTSVFVALPTEHGPADRTV